MYFIARNNAVYNFIAHTDLRRCYIATFAALSVLFFVGAHIFYYPLLAYNILLKSECSLLKKKQAEATEFDKDNHKRAVIFTSCQQSVARHMVADNVREEYCHKKTLFILDVIARLGMTLNAYGSCKETDKKWYTKNLARFDVTCSLQQLLTFLETIRNACMMIVIPQITITRVIDDTFQMSFDAAFITIKKKESPSTLNKLKG